MKNINRCKNVSGLTKGRSPNCLYHKDTEIQLSTKNNMENSELPMTQTTEIVPCHAQPDNSEEADAKEQFTKTLS